MAQLTDLQLQGQGPFYCCNEYFEKMQELRKRYAKPVKGPRWRTGSKPPPYPTQPSAMEVRPTPATMIEAAVDLTMRHLDSWLVMAAAPGARVSVDGYVPYAGSLYDNVSEVRGGFIVLRG